MTIDTWTSQRRVLVLGILLGLVAGPLLKAAADSAWKVLFNGKDSTIKVVKNGDTETVPVYFPIPEEGRKQSYGVLLETDPITMQIKITRVKKDLLVRDVGDCPMCRGSADCQDCYPAGSGVNTAETACYTCNGGGDCYMCSGSGKCYVCGGRGFENTCNTCGKTSRP